MPGGASYRSNARTWLCVAVFAIAVALHAAPAQSAVDTGEFAEEAFSIVESLLRFVISPQDLRDQTNEGCRIRGILPLHAMVGAQRAYHINQIIRSQRRTTRSWVTGDFLEDPRPIRKPYANKARRLRKYLPAETLVFTCYEFDTGLIEGDAEGNFYVLAKPRACGKLGDRTYYFDPVAGYRYEDGCQVEAGPTSPPVSDLVEGTGG